MAYNIKKKTKEKLIRIMDYKNSSQRFRPLGPSVLVVQFSDSLALRTESSLKDRFKEHRRPVMFPKLTVKSKPTSVSEHVLSHSDHSNTDIQLIPKVKIHSSRDSV